MTPIAPFGLHDQDKTTPNNAATHEGMHAAAGAYTDAQIALKGEKIWPDDPRIANPIDLTGAKFSDVGFQELLDLADPGYQVQGVGTIAWPAHCKVKLQAEHAQSARVLHWAPDNRNNGPIWEWSRNAFSEGANGVYAAATSTGLKGGNPAVVTGQTTIKLVGVNGTFKPSGTALLGGKPFTYGKISHVEGEGENRTTWLEECVGVVGNGRAWVMQGVAMQIAGDGSHLTVLPAGLRIIGPGIGTGATWGKAEEPAGLDGVWIDNAVGINCQFRGFRHNAVASVERWELGDRFDSRQGYSGFAMKGPLLLSPEGEYNQVRISDNYWCGVWIDHQFTVRGIIRNSEMGNNPWPFWKVGFDATWGNNKVAMYELEIDGLTCEGAGFGFLGCPDGQAMVSDCKFAHMDITPNANNYTTYAEPAKFLALFVGEMENVEITHSPNFFLQAHNEKIGSMFLGNLQKNVVIPDFGLFLPASIPIVKPFGEATGASTDIRFRGGRVGSQSSADTPALKGDVLEFREKFGNFPTQIQRNAHVNAAVAGVAQLAASGRVVPYFTDASFRSIVRVKEQSNPPTSVAGEANATAGTLEAKPYFARVCAVLSGGGLMAASAEVSVTPAAGKSIKWKWTAPAEIPHGQTILHYRVFISPTSGVYSGYVEVGNILELTWSGAVMTGATTPPTKNTGCEIYGTTTVPNLVRSNAVAATGTACVASGPADPNGVMVGTTQGKSDNGETCEILVTPTTIGS